MLTIKDPEAHRLARELADLENTTMTAAVVAALQSALDEHSRRRQRRRAVLRGLIESARAEGVDYSGDPFADLYDEETGLPR